MAEGAEMFRPVASAPYAFPFDGVWSAADTAVLLLGFDLDLVAELGAQEAMIAAVTLAEAARSVGVTVIGSVPAGDRGAGSATGPARPMASGHPGAAQRNPGSPSEQGASLRSRSRIGLAPVRDDRDGPAAPPSQWSPEQVAAELGLAPADIVAQPGDNAFYGTDLEARLRVRGVRNLLIAGLPTDGLVHATMRTANDMGFECLAVSDACCGTSPERHAAQLRITTFGNGLFGTVAPLAAVLAALS